jgi:hypothetical protein
MMSKNDRDEGAGPEPERGNSRVFKLTAPQRFRHPIPSEKCDRDVSASRAHLFAVGRLGPQRLVDDFRNSPD